MTSALDKIRKLLAMTVASGCTEDEQESAMRIAAGLAARNGIDLDAVRPKDQKRTIKRKRFADKLKPHQALCAEAAAVLIGVEAHVENLGIRGFWFTGREENVDLAEQAMFWLFRQIEELYKTHLPRGLSQQKRSEFRKTFKAACALRVFERAKKLIDEMRTSDANAQSATGKNALVVANYFDTLQREVKEFWQDMYRLTPEQEKERDEVRKAHAQWRRDNPKEAAMLDKVQEKEARKWRPRRGRQIPVGSGSNVGYSAGDNVKLRKEVQ